MCASVLAINWHNYNEKENEGSSCQIDHAITMFHYWLYKSVFFFSECHRRQNIYFAFLCFVQWNPTEFLSQRPRIVYDGISLSHKTFTISLALLPDKSGAHATRLNVSINNFILSLDQWPHRPELNIRFVRWDTHVFGSHIKKWAAVCSLAVDYWLVDWQC